MPAHLGRLWSALGAAEFAGPAHGTTACAPARQPSTRKTPSRSFDRSRIEEVWTMLWHVKSGLSQCHDGGIPAESGQVRKTYLQVDKLSSVDSFANLRWLQLPAAFTSSTKRSCVFPNLGKSRDYQVCCLVDFSRYDCDLCKLHCNVRPSSPNHHGLTARTAWCPSSFCICICICICTT